MQLASKNIHDNIITKLPPEPIIGIGQSADRHRHIPLICNIPKNPSSACVFCQVFYFTTAPNVLQQGASNGSLRATPSPQS